MQGVIRPQANPQRLTFLHTSASLFRAFLAWQKIVASLSWATRAVGGFGARWTANQPCKRRIRKDGLRSLPFDLCATEPAEQGGSEIMRRDSRRPIRKWSLSMAVSRSGDCYALKQPSAPTGSSA